MKYIELAEGPALLGILVFDLEKCCPGGCVSSVGALARDWLILSTKEQPRILIAAWGGTNMILIGAWHKPTNKHIYIPTPQIYEYILYILLEYTA